jgi:hypothetical protein
MSKEATSKLARHGRRALVTLGLGRQPTGGPYVAIAGFAVVAGAVFMLSFARKALSGFPRRAKSLSMGRDRPPARSSGAASAGRWTSTKGVSEDAAHGAMEGSEADELERAENEGMYPSRW